MPGLSLLTLEPKHLTDTRDHTWNFDYMNAVALNRFKAVEK